MKQIDLPLYKFYLIENMTQEDLNELALERNNLSEEVYRLNNIINELEKWLNEWKNWIDRPDEFEDGIISCINDTLGKLQELKGVDKE